MQDRILKHSCLEQPVSLILDTEMGTDMKSSRAMTWSRQPSPGTGSLDQGMADLSWEGPGSKHFRPAGHSLPVAPPAPSRVAQTQSLS